MMTKPDKLRDAGPTDGNRYRKLRGWMGSNIQEGWRQVEQLAAIACYLDFEAFDNVLDTLPECNIGLMHNRDSVPAPASETPEVDALMAKWDDDGATRGPAFLELRDKARQLERCYHIALDQCRALVDFHIPQSAPGGTPEPASAREAELLVALQQVRPLVAALRDAVGHPDNAAIGDRALALIDNTPPAANAARLPDWRAIAEGHALQAADLQQQLDDLRRTAADAVAQEGVAGLRPYEFSVNGTSLRWYLKRDVDALLTDRAPAADAVVLPPSEPLLWAALDLNGRIVYQHASRENVDTNRRYIKTPTRIVGLVVQP